jgi:Excalibur calcium-binding domain
MFIVATLLAITPIVSQSLNQPIFETGLGYTKKKHKVVSTGSGRRFGSCKAARKAGYTHMRRGQPGYSANLDRDGDGIACDKVK